MASTLRLGSRALRSSIVPKSAVQSATFNGLRYYSSAKTKVSDLELSIGTIGLTNWLAVPSP